VSPTPAHAPLQNVESLRHSVESLTVELLAVYEELALLYSVGAQIGRLADEAQIAAVALKEAINISSADCGWVALSDGERLRAPEGCRMGVERNTVDHIHQTVLENLFRRGKRDFVSHALTKEYLLGEDDAPERFLASALALEGELHGYLCLGRWPAGSIFLSPDQKLMSALAILVAVELENVRLQRSEMEKRRMVSELELARTIQQALSPRDFRSVAFLDAAGASEPSCEIGGDFFDLIPINENLCTLVIADVSGKGPSAALQAVMMQGIVHAVTRNSPTLPSLMATLNECLLKRSLAGGFATVFAATLHRGGRLRYANGGHVAPLWIQANGRVSELAEGGPLLGVFPRLKYAQQSVQLAPGDLLVLYTDGVTEAEITRGDRFGTARLLDWGRHQWGRPPADVRDSLIAAVNHFCGGKRESDDRSVLVVQYRGRKLRRTYLSDLGQRQGKMQAGRLEG
jgi:serine phosphatase RsbU (regulator of sigma subunit)